ncbi:hypothetical protein [Streptomyces sp. IBSBF 2435]|uniref:hypothetical protein n=1 Tax=Streptomyces sp. IBSBF 2435 TaxID=2903531 RepID=UPI002FDBD04C
MSPARFDVMIPHYGDAAMLRAAVRAGAGPRRLALAAAGGSAPRAAASAAVPPAEAPVAGPPPT